MLCNPFLDLPKKRVFPKEGVYRCDETIYTRVMLAETKRGDMRVKRFSSEFRRTVVPAGQ